LSERRIAPFGGEAVAGSACKACLSEYQGRFAAQRGQAPSPQDARQA